MRDDPLAVVVASMLIVAGSHGLRLLDAASPDTAALMNGAAAIISAIAAIVAAQRNGESELVIRDHEARLRVLEDRANRSS